MPLLPHIKDKGKGKDHPLTGHEGPEVEYRYRSTLSLTSALYEGGWSTPHSGRFTPGKDPVPIVQEAGWAPGPVWTGVENLAPPARLDPQTVQPVGSRYTNYATRSCLENDMEDISTYNTRNLF